MLEQDNVTQNFEGSKDRLNTIELLRKDVGFVNGANFRLPNNNELE
jgi:hypothetical protein